MRNVELKKWDLWHKNFQQVKNTYFSLKNSITSILHWNVILNFSKKAFFELSGNPKTWFFHLSLCSTLRSISSKPSGDSPLFDCTFWVIFSYSRWLNLQKLLGGRFSCLDSHKMEKRPRLDLYLPIDVQIVLGHLGRQVLQDFQCQFHTLVKCPIDTQF